MNKYSHFDDELVKKEKINEIKYQIKSALERSTFHGIDIILETSKGWKRILVSGFVIVMSIVAAIGSMYSLIRFLNFPYKTLVNYEQKSFKFPELTICPFSPFNELKFLASVKEVKEKYNEILTFWSGNDSINKHVITKLKRSFTATFYQFGSNLRMEWHSMILNCYYNGKSCLKNIVPVEHPMPYICFRILNLSQSEGARSGYGRGIELILYRNSSSKPMLMINEFFDKIFGEFTNIKNDPREFDGVLILIHNKNEIPAFKLTASPNVYPIIYGNSITITMKEKYYKQTSTHSRRCSKTAMFYKLLVFQGFFRSRAVERPTTTLALNLENCISRFRQYITSIKCNCFSELEMIPSDFIESLKNLGFCYDIFWSRRKSREDILNQIQCSQEIELMTNEEVIKSAIQYKVYKACKIPCDRYILNIKRVQTNKLIDSMKLSLFSNYFQILKQENLQNSFQSQDIRNAKIYPENLMYIDVHAEEERIPILDEDLDKNFGNFIAEVGGMFSLFLGLSGVTAYEILECLILLSLIAMIMWSKNPNPENKPTPLK